MGNSSKPCGILEVFNYFIILDLKYFGKFIFRFLILWFISKYA